MLRYGSTYRSPFNGPRWGAVLAMIAILFGQAVWAFHDPGLSGVHPGTGNVCTGSACNLTECDDSIAVDRHDALSGFFDTDTAYEGSMCCCGDSAAAEDDCSGDDCEQDCRHCCHHVPMSSPLSSPHVSLQHKQASLALPTHPFILAADITPPFHPPRG